MRNSGEIGMGVTRLSVGALAAAVILLSGTLRQVREAAIGGALMAAEPAQAAAKGQTGVPPSDQPKVQAAQPRPVGATGATPPGSATDLNAVRDPFAQPTALPLALPGMPEGRAQTMPANPFSAVPTGATALRPAATYGMQVEPAPAVGNERVDKAFAHYRRPRAVSPYMFLNTFGRIPGVDNYNAYVRPQLQEQEFEQHVMRTFRGLQPERGFLGGTGPSFNQPYTTGPGIHAATFMSFQPYYPNYPTQTYPR
jgi:hypothetical protein